MHKANHPEGLVMRNCTWGERDYKEVSKRWATSMQGPSKLCGRVYV